LYEAFKMRNIARLNEWASAYNLPDPSAVPLSPRRSNTSGPASLLAPVEFNGHAYRDIATNELQQVRMSKLAGSSRLSLLKSDQVNEKKQHKWVYSKKELGDALEKVFVRGSDPGLGQALIEYDPNDRLDINVREVDESASKKNGKGRGESARGVVKTSKWLERAAGDGRLDWTQMFASRGPSQQSLNSALQVALASSSIKRTDVCGCLLSYGADANIALETCLEAIQMGNLPLLESFLTRSRTGLSGPNLTHLLRMGVSLGAFPMVSLLLANGASCNQAFDETIHSSIQLFNVQMLCTLLLGSLQKPLEPTYVQKAVETVCNLRDDQGKSLFDSQL
jgi:hypothetical protein